MKVSKEFSRIVRICGTDLDGNRPLVHALTAVEGVGTRLAHAAVKVAKLDPQTRMGYLSIKDAKRLEAIIKDPTAHGIPTWFLNRRKDRTTGKDAHLIGSDLALQRKMDVDFLKKIETRRGVRHALGLKVRGQRTKTTGRKTLAIGVSKKGVARRR